MMKRITMLMTLACSTIMNPRSSEGKTQDNDNQYTLGVGSLGNERLNVLNTIHNPSTQAFLLKQDVEGKKAILDVGCGNGIMTRWFGENAAGEVLGIDNSEKQIAVAKEQNSQPNVDFMVLSAYDLDKLGTEQFDLIYCRFLLIHLKDPNEVLAKMYSCLKPGGMIVCEEANARTCFCSSKNESFDQWKLLWDTLHSFKNTKKSFELELENAFKHVGLKNIQTAFYQPVLTSAETKKILWYDAKETYVSAKEAGFYVDKDYDDFLADLEQLAEDTNCKVHYVNKLQICGTKN